MYKNAANFSKNWRPNFLTNQTKKQLFLGHFLLFLPVFRAKEVFIRKKNLALPRATSYGFPAPCQNLEKNNDPILSKHPGRWKDGQTLFCRTLPATAVGPINIVHEKLAKLLTNTYISNKKQCSPPFYRYPSL